MIVVLRHRVSGWFVTQQYITVALLGGSSFGLGGWMGRENQELTCKLLLGVSVLNKAVREVNLELQGRLRGARASSVSGQLWVVGKHRLAHSDCSWIHFIHSFLHSLIHRADPGKVFKLSEPHFPHLESGEFLRTCDPVFPVQRHSAEPLYLRLPCKTKETVSTEALGEDGETLTSQCDLNDVEKMAIYIITVLEKNNVLQ